MKHFSLFFGLVLTACVWYEPKQEVCSREEALDGVSELAIYIGDSYLGRQEDVNEAALAACRMWESIGVSCSLAESAEDADVYVDFVSDWDCRGAGFVGRVGDYYGGKIGIWVNYASICLPSDDVYGWFTHLVAHELGHMFGVEDVPFFCGDAVMNPAIERLQPTTFLSAITEIDRNAFGERRRNSLLLGGAVLDCGDDEPQKEREVREPPSSDCADEIDAPEIAIGLWLEPEVWPWNREIADGCSRWAPVGVSCFFSLTREEADVIVREYESDTCGVAGYTYYYDRSLLGGPYAVEVNLDCMPSDPNAASEWIRKVAAHELAHTEGVEHIPFFCGNAVMNPALNSRNCISGADVSAWRERYENYLK